MRTIKLFATILGGLALCFFTVTAQDPKTNSVSGTVIYNRITKDGAAYDEAVRKAFSTNFTVVDLTNSVGYTPPKPIAGGLPKVAVLESGEWLSGSLFVAYIITTNGYAKEAFVLKTSDTRLNSFAFKAMKGWRFQPALLDGEVVSVTAVQEFRFKKP